MYVFFDIVAVHKVCHAIFGQFPPRQALSHIRDPQKSTSHISDSPPILSRPSTKTPDKSPLYKFSLNFSRGFCPGVLSGGLLSGRFCPGWFLSPFCQNTSVTTES